MDKTTLIKVTNRDNGSVGYTIPELGISRQFSARESKDITFGELESLSFQPGGTVLLEEYLIINDADAAKELLHSVEPEYYYTTNDVIRMLTTATLDEFLDCLDFAPEGVKEMIKDKAVSLPLNDMSKREAIFNKLGFNVTKAIEIQKMKYDGEEDDNTSNAEPAKKERRVNASNTPARRAEAPKSKYSKKETE